MASALAPALASAVASTLASALPPLESCVGGGRCLAAAAHARKALLRTQSGLARGTASVGLHVAHRDLLAFVDITQHVLMPKHRKLSTTEKERVLDQYGRETAMYPKILLDDPMARYLGLQAGDMVHVQRSIPYLGSRPMYRLAFANAS